MNTVRRTSRAGVVAAAFVLTTGVIGASAAQAHGEVLNVVTTTSDLASIAQAVAGEHAVVTSICGGREDPHFMQAKPSYIVAARRADLWIRVGMELEIGWEGPVLNGARNARIRVGAPGHLDASESVIRLDVPSTRVTRAMGDVHPAGNPHYWLDPLNGRIVAKSIADRLIQLAPEHTDAFESNLGRFEKQLDAKMFGQALCHRIGGRTLWALQLNGKLGDYLKVNSLEDELGGWLGGMLPFQGQKIVTHHRSWLYFAERFGLEVAMELEAKPGIPPSAKHLGTVVDRVRAERIKVILTEPFYGRKAADIVAGKTGTTVVVCANAVAGQDEATDYLQLLDLIVSRLSDAM